MWDVSSATCAFPALFWWLPTINLPPGMGGNVGVQYEWYFRSSLDHWSTFLGMIFALNFPPMLKWFEKVGRTVGRTSISARKE